MPGRIFFAPDAAREWRAIDRRRSVAGLPALELKPPGDTDYFVTGVSQQSSRLVVRGHAIEPGQDPPPGSIEFVD